MNAPLPRNVIWFLASLGLAFVVWVTATTQSDPIREELVTSFIDVNFPTDPGMLVTQASSEQVRVRVRGRQSVLDLITPEDITVTADLRGRSPGEQTVDLTADVGRRQAIADPQPARITVMLEQELSQQKQVVVQVENPPPLGFELSGTPTPSEAQVLVTGAASLVAQVEQLVAPIDLSQQREDYNDEVALVPVDEDGETVEGVEIAQPVNVTADITQLEDVQEVFVATPNVDRSTLPEGYIFVGIIDYNPKVVSVTGNLTMLPEALQTEVIDLSNATSTFTTTTELRIPEGIELYQGQQSTINVTIGIEARPDVRQIDDVPVTIIGQPAGAEVSALPETVTVLIRGPQPVVRDLTIEDVRVEIDLEGEIPNGSVELEPIAVVNVPGIQPADVSVLPPTVLVTVTESGE